MAISPFLLTFVMIQPAYFFANPSLYSLFSALVADRGVTVDRNIPYADHPRLKLDIYSPVTGATQAKTPIILFLYGGTWKEGDRAIYGFVGAALAARGITTVIPDYRLFPDVRYPMFLEDAAHAYIWTRRHFSDPTRPLIVMGHSAGAHMAAMLALHPKHVRDRATDIAMPGGLVGLAGPYAYDLTTHASTQELFPDEIDAAETIPANFVHAGAPPTLLIHGALDDTVKLANQRMLAEKLKALKVPVETHEPDGTTHVGLIRSLAWPFRRQSPAIELIVEFTHRLGRKGRSPE